MSEVIVGAEEVLAFVCIVVDVLDESLAEDGNLTEGSDDVVSLVEACRCMTASVDGVEEAVFVVLVAIVVSGTDGLAVERSMFALATEISGAAVEISLR